MEALRFAKHQALGNDFLIALMQPDEETAFAESQLKLPALAAQLCDRSSGIGADGLILATDMSTTQPSAAPDAPETASAATVRQVRMTLFNSDGSSAEVSGNGLACLANEVARTLVSSMEFCEGAEALDSILELTVDTVDGARRVTLSAEFATTESGSVELVDPLAEVHMPDVAPGPNVTAELDEQISTVFGDTQRAIGNVGNPHLVINAVRPMNARETADLGAAFEAHFPSGINVEFIWRTEHDGSTSAAPSSIGMSVWERGAGLTQACGTGAVTAAMRAQDWGLVTANEETTVEMPGGEATISTDDDDGHPILSVWVEHLGDYEWPVRERSPDG
ncbi:diaminopimelate epimerase [Candidatus Poriferisodalis sp.]|uniref:diaminopimelate epimerase n=1 Tax=Candidatus Poriferisodalis sp. TaxID=3101277 RepID=UPI003AF432CD